MHGADYTADAVLLSEPGALDVGTESEMGQEGRYRGGITYSLYGLLLSPEAIRTVFNIPQEESFRANVILGWISP